MDDLILFDATIEFDIKSKTDRIITANLDESGITTVHVGLTNDFMDEVVGFKYWTFQLSHLS